MSVMPDPPAPTFGEQLVSQARKWKGRKENPLGSNGDQGGPIDGWLAYVGCEPGVPWCSGYACSMVRDTREALKIPSLRFRKSAGALRLLALNEDLRTDDPQVGDLIIWDHGGGHGHVSIKTGPTTHIAGNTSADGKSRNGTEVAEHDYDPADPKIAGHIRVA